MSKGWPLVRMEDIFEIARGGSPRPIDTFLTEDPAGVNWVMISDATESGKYINSTKKRIRQEGVTRSRMVKPGDFLLTNSMSFGRPYVMNTSGCVHDGWLVLSPRDHNVSSDFFYHLLGSDLVYGEFVRRAAGATVKNLNIDLVKSVRVPLPAISEQRRIAEVLDRTDALRVKRRAALAQLDTVTQSIFLDLFGDLECNSKNYPLRALAHSIQLKGGFAFKSADYVTDGIPLVRIGEVNRGGVTRGSACFLPQGYAISYSRFVLRPGDMLMSLTGTTGKDDYGNVIILDDTFDRYLLNQRVALLQPDAKFLDRHYLFYLLRQPKIKSRLTAKSRGIRQANISNGDVLEMNVPLPPLLVQREFSCHFACAEKLKAEHRASLTQMDALFAALQHRAFRGEL